MSDAEWVPEGIDPSVPSVARMYDYYLQGKDNYASDRAVGDKVIAVSIESGTDIRIAARLNRGFLGRSVQALAESGIRQFLDVGTGLPTQENVHQVALRAAPDAQIAYVDNDPAVLAHARALLADNPRTSVVRGDLTDPDAILADPAVAARIDFGKPVAMIFCAILQFVSDDEQALAILARFKERACPGSHIVISHPFPGEAPAAAFDGISSAYTTTKTGSFTIRTRPQVAAFFAGTELLEPGLVPVGAWRSGVEPDFTAAAYLGGVGRIP